MYLVFDIGGTKTRIGLTSDLETIIDTVKFKTPLLFEEAMEKFIAEAKGLLKGERVIAIAGGIRGPLNHEKTRIVSETVLTDWIDKPLAERLSEAFSAPCYLENDAALVGLGEASVGSGKDYSIVAYYTVSTGVGGARIVNGQVDVTHSGFEPGKQMIDIDHTVHPELSLSGTLEELISGESLEKRMGKKPYEVPQTDPVWDELALYLAYGLKNTIVYWSPDVVVLGGSMIIGDPRILRIRVQKKTEELLKGLVPCPPIVDGVLKDEGGLYGALALLRARKAPENQDMT